MYVDKTDIVWNLVNKGKKYNYLSRPRRFGKSVLVDTLQTYFKGRRELFEGLKIMDLETDWTYYPVIRLDMNNGGNTAEELRSYLSSVFKDYEKNVFRRSRSPRQPCRAVQQHHKDCQTCSRAENRSAD